MRIRKAQPETKSRLKRKSETGRCKFAPALSRFAPVSKTFPGRNAKKYTGYCIIACVPMWLRGKDLNQRPPGYEPDELPTALPRDICKRYISIDRPPRQGLKQKTFRPDLPGPAPNCLYTADREGKRHCGALLFRMSGVCLRRTERARRMPCRESAFPGPTGGTGHFAQSFFHISQFYFA